MSDSESAVQAFLDDNPAATWDEVWASVKDKVPQRAGAHRVYNRLSRKYAADNGRKDRERELVT